jgi:hypothetical protein
MIREYLVVTWSGILQIFSCYLFTCVCARARVKVNSSLCVSRHEDSTYSDHLTLDGERVISFKIRPLSSQGMILRYPPHKRLGWPWSRFVLKRLIPAPAESRIEAIESRSLAI